MTSRLLLCFSLCALLTLQVSASPAHANTSGDAGGTGPGAAGPPTSTPLRRFALVIGSNNGGNVREQLRYAGHDANTIADVLRQLGGVNQVDLSLLSEPEARDVDRAFDAMSERVRTERKRGQRVELVVYYSGHADDTGTPKANLRLSEKRAKAVVAYLVQQGVKASRLRAFGYGDTHPLSTDRSDEGRARNRRVEIRVPEERPGKRHKDRQR